MSSFTIKCDRCQMQVDHRCSANLGDAIKRLLMWRPEGGMPEVFHLNDQEAVIAHAKKTKYFAEGDEKAPFFSEAFLYDLLGKEDARTFMALIHTIVAEAGIEMMPIRQAAYEELHAEEEEQKRRTAIRELVQRNNKRKCVCKHVYGSHHSTEESMKERKNRRPCAKCDCPGFSPATDADILERPPPHPDDGKTIVTTTNGETP